MGFYTEEGAAKGRELMLEMPDLLKRNKKQTWSKTLTKVALERDGHHNNKK